VPAGSDGTGWVQQRWTGGDPALQGVWGRSADDVFAVGGEGLILHYDGQVWSPQASGSAADLIEVFGSSGADVYAVGPGSTVLHYDGNAWSPVDVGVAGDFYGVWVSANGDTIYIVGADGVILKGQR